ncbi:alpha/beta-hydrolase [Atractiella rhizophila]|nr:alpha/beta-hydrolase [Atractiella rhizophila]
MPTTLYPDEFEAHSADLHRGVDAPADTKLFFLIRKSVKEDATPVVLLHGYPQNHTLWYQVAPLLPLEYDVIIPDLPGYGNSKKEPSADGSWSNYSKRAMGNDIVHLIDEIYGEGKKFIACGHDRGARVCYRLGLDHPDRMLGINVQDIVPFTEVFDSLSRNRAAMLGTYHWIFLALPPPLPEQLISANPDLYIRHTIDSWTGTRFKGNFDENAMQSWILPYRNPRCVQGALADYRAGFRCDTMIEEEDRQNGRKLQVPVLQLCSIHLSSRQDVEGIWKRLVAEESLLTQARIGDDQTGHFLPVERHEEVATRLAEWLKKVII